MFLYAKIVLGNLFAPTHTGSFQERAQNRKLSERPGSGVRFFPVAAKVVALLTGQSYERVVIQILEGPDEDQNGLARQILDLVICAENPLFWKEI